MSVGLVAGAVLRLRAGDSQLPVTTRVTPVVHHLPVEVR